MKDIHSSEQHIFPKGLVVKSSTLGKAHVDKGKYI